MRRACLLIAFTACASTGTRAPEGASTQAKIFSGPDTPTMFADAPRGVSLTLAASPTATWAAVKKVYADLEVPLTVENPAAHQLGNADFYKTRQFGGRPMPELVNCGSGMTGPNAVSWRIYMSLLTTVTAGDNGSSILKTTFSALGRDISGGSSDKIVCGSSGRLENMFLERVKATIGG